MVSFIFLKILDFIIIEDLTYKMSKPAVMDLKIGYIESKAYKEDFKSVSSMDLCFRLMGLQVILFI